MPGKPDLHAGLTLHRHRPDAQSLGPVFHIQIVPLIS
jgi:hypothetical protein